MKAKRARRLKIRGQTWRVVIGRTPMNLCDGVCEPSTRTIYISPNRRVDRKGTCVHEILHALFPDIEEDVIREAEQAIMEGLRIIETLT